MNPEQLSDAMNELPQELLEETQAARSRRRPRWRTPGPGRPGSAA